MGLIGSIGLGVFPSQALSLVLKKDSHRIRSFAEPYLRIRSLTFLPNLLSMIGFGVFRGLQDVVTPLRISVYANLLMIFLNPFLIFTPFHLGIIGSSCSTCISDFISFYLYSKELMKKQFISFSNFTLPSFGNMLPLLLGGLKMQLRAIALNIALLAVTRSTQRLDSTGVSAAAHTISMQLFHLGSITSSALSTVASIIIPIELSKAKKQQLETGSLEGYKKVKIVTNRLLLWGFLIGICLMAGQLLALPLLSFFTPLVEIQQAARMPSTIGAFLQLLNCFAWTGEGILQGYEAFSSLAQSSVLGTLGLLLTLQFSRGSLMKVWLSFIVLATIRIIGIFRHHHNVVQHIEKHHWKEKHEREVIHTTSEPKSSEDVEVDSEQQEVEPLIAPEESNNAI
jgi:MATE family multidrug resistance protein